MTASMHSVLDERAGTPSSPDDSLSDQQLLLDCGICGQQFASKKQLRTHIHTHLRKPRIVLRRVTGPKIVKVRKPCEDTYWLDPEKKGLLKLTLKKQSISESLKLTLKKSSESEDFTVVNSNFNPVIKDHQQGEVAGAKENDQKSNKTAKGSVNEPFENVMVDQQVSCFVGAKVEILFVFYNSFVYRMIMTTLNLMKKIIILWRRMKDHP